MKKAYLFIGLLFLGLNGFAQEAEITRIRELYQHTQNLIDTSMIMSEEPHGGLYCNELTVNKFGSSWRAVGNYLKVIRFWYSDQPYFAGIENGSKESALCKVEMSATYAGNNTETWELLYDKGKLIFCFIKDASYAYAENPKEMRWYFADGKLIRYMEGQHIMEEMPDTKELQEISNKMMELFFTTFN